jgi:bacillithiol biosynthesis cysteine-adding enzyme BshC
MNSECYPISMLPGTTAVFRDYADQRGSVHAAQLRRWYPMDPFSMEWANGATVLDEAHRARLADALLGEAGDFGAGDAVTANIERLRNGAAAVVTGQQVALFGGPLLTLLKAATAIRKAQDATKASGREHVPVFWLASEDHDLAEVDQVALLAKNEIETLRLGLNAVRPVPVGGIAVDGDHDDGRGALEATLDRACELLGWGPVCDLLRACYAPGATLAGAFGRLLTNIFAAQGLVVMDAASHEFHALGARVLRAAIERADELEEALLRRSEELVEAGYHAQVLVARGHSLLFLLDAAGDEQKSAGQKSDEQKSVGQAGARLPLRRTAEGGWKAGARSYSTEDLLEILEREPERLSPSALLRPVFQDAMLPTAA